jgi:uncharacterized membrane protein YfcA
MLDFLPALSAASAVVSAHAPALIATGFGVGLTVGLTGVGGGSLMTPALIFGFGVPPQIAVGTDLLFAAATKAAGSAELARSRRIDWRIVLALSAGSIPAALLTLWVISQVGGGSKEAHAAIKSVLGVALLLTAAATAWKVWKGNGAARSADINIPIPFNRHLMAASLGAGIGALVSLTSVGAGAIGVTALLLLYPMIATQRIVAADIAYAVPLTLIAGIGHATLGHVDWSLLGALLVGSLPGIWIGTKLSHKTPERALRGLLTIPLAWAGSKLLFF